MTLKGGPRLHLAVIAKEYPPNNFSPLRLPPHSHELTAQENIWQFLPHNFLTDRIFDTYDEIVDVCCYAWNALTAETGRIISIASRDWLHSVSSLVGLYWVVL